MAVDITVRLLEVAAIVYFLDVLFYVSFGRDPLWSLLSRIWSALKRIAG